MSTPPPTATINLLRPVDPEPPPPPPPPGRAIRLLGRVLLWTLIALGALHGLLPAPAAPNSAPFPGAPVNSSSENQTVMAVAAAFLREYLTVDGRQPGRSGRLRRFLARDVDVDESVVPRSGVSQSTDLVVPAGVRPTSGGAEVTVVAHLLQARDGPAQDGGTVAFVVPMVTGSGGVAVGGLPRPAALPVDPGLRWRPAALPMTLARAVAAAAGHAVAAVLNGDRPALRRLGGGEAPAVRAFPDGWRPVEIVAVQPAGPPRTPTAQVLVRARPPAAGIEYLVPVRVSLRGGARTPTVREVDAGGAP